MFKVLLFISLITTNNLSANDFSKYICTTYQKVSTDVLVCLGRDGTSQNKLKSFTKELDTLVVNEVRTDLTKEGVTFVDPITLTTLFNSDELQAVKADLAKKGVTLIDPLTIGSLFNSEKVDPVDRKELYADKSCYYETAYKVEEFNRLPSTHSTILRLENLAAALKSSGICSAEIHPNYPKHNIQVRNNDDLLEHFLCISNFESVFGRDNIGLGGRGPWGIHPMHNLPKGAQVKTSTGLRTLLKDQLCYPSKAVVRDANNEEINSSKEYYSYEVQLANAQCAMKLYAKNKYAPWGKTDSWGSNRHCLKKDKDRFKIKEKIGIHACCTEECKEKVNSSI